jgi:aspartate/methionine/tyrosine aminotransferase
MAGRAGVVPVPTDTFYLNRQHGEQIARFSFCQSRETLRAAAERISQRLAPAEAIR